MLRLPQGSDYTPWRELRLASRKHLEPFEPTWGATDHDRPAFRQRVRRAAAQARAGTDYSFFVFLGSGNHYQLTGGITLSNVRYAVARQANLGYWTGVRYAGKGIMTEAVGLVCDYAFDQLNLNRIHAAFMPHNQASRRVLAKNHFVEEGFAERYLRIDGDWRDHVTCGLTRQRYAQMRSEH